MIEIGLAISIASSAFNTIKKAVETGREIEDVAGFFVTFFDAKDNIVAAGESAKNQPFAKKLFSGSSVEAQALEVTAARYKIASLEKELREFLIYTGQGQFYEDMMKERRNIRESRLREAARKAENRKLLIDTLTIGLIVVFCDWNCSSNIWSGYKYLNTSAKIILDLPQ